MTDRCRETLFLELARLLRAGAPAGAALAAVRDVCGGRLGPALDASAILVEGGTPVAEAGVRCRWLTGRDASLLAAGERVGRLVTAAELLSRRYRARARRAGRIRAGLVSPAFVLVVGVVLAPLPALVGGDLDVSGFALAVLGPLVAAALAAFAVARATRWIHDHGWPRSLAGAILSLPVVGTMVVRAARTEVLEALSLMLAAGSTADEALAAAVSGVSHPHLRARFSQGTARLRDGQSLSRVLRAAGVLDPEAFAIVSAAESAGRMEEALRREAERGRALLDGAADQAAMWLPRAAYLAVVGFLASHFL